MVKKPPLTTLKGCGKPFYQPRYRVRWQYKKVGLDLEVIQEFDSMVCGRHQPGHRSKEDWRKFTRSQVLLCEACLKKEGIIW